LTGAGIDQILLRRQRRGQDAKGISFDEVKAFWKCWHVYFKMFDFTCTGAGGGATCVCTGPCVDPAPDGANTQSGAYWSATNYVPFPLTAWNVISVNGGVNSNDERNAFSVRAVRGGM